MKITFKQILKRKLYPTWVSIKYKGCKAYVMQIPNTNTYHYQIICDDNQLYCSLDEDVKFDSFEDCCEAAEKWLIENRL
jgi:hypothetical protein